MRPFNVSDKTFNLSNAILDKSKNPNLFYHFSLSKLDKLKNINKNKTLSFFFSKPIPECIEKFRENGMKDYGKLKTFYYIYIVDLSKHKDKIYMYYIQSTQKETMLRISNSRFNSMGLKEKNRVIKKETGREVYFTNYDELKENFTNDWLDFERYTQMQLNYIKMYPEYKTTFNPAIPYLVCGIKEGEELDIEHTELITPK